MRVSAGDGPSPKQLALASISREFEDCGLCLTNFNLLVEGDVETLLAHVDEMHRTDVSDVLDVPLPTADELQAQIASLNTEQRVVFDAVTEAVRDESGNDRLFFVDGPGGSGKTYLLNLLANTILSEGGTVVSCAYTGLAASLLVKGRTSHSVFGIPAEDVDETTESNLRLQSRDCRELRDCSIIIWDEIGQSSKGQLGLVDRLLRAVCDRPDA